MKKIKVEISILVELLLERYIVEERNHTVDEVKRMICISGDPEIYTYKEFIKMELKKIKQVKM